MSRISVRALVRRTATTGVVAAVTAGTGAGLPGPAQAGLSVRTTTPVYDVTELVAPQREFASERAVALGWDSAFNQPAAPKRASRAATRVPLDPRGVARILVAKRGWRGGQFRCLDALWTRESNWRTRADNPSSSAYGIPQALPGSKMATFGADWRTNPATQIRWGLSYIARSYGTPCAAWAHSTAYNYY